MCVRVQFQGGFDGEEMWMAGFLGHEERNRINCCEF